MVMIHTPDAHNTKHWTNVLLKSPLNKDQWEWLLAHDSRGMYHIHRSNTAIKFEYQVDAKLFAMRWS